MLVLSERSAALFALVAEPLPDLRRLPLGVSSLCQLRLAVSTGKRVVGEPRGPRALPRTGPHSYAEHSTGEGCRCPA